MQLNAETPRLFREAALRHRVDRLHGNVSIVTPIAWQLIGFLMLAGLVAAALFLSLGSYARIETVSGSIALDKGVATVVPTRAGIIQNIAVAEGERVHAGQQLAVVRAEENMIGGATAPNRILDALNRQDAQLADQRTLQLQASAAEQLRLRAQIAGATAALPALKAQLADQRELIAAAEADYEGAKEVAARGYISKRDMELRQATILTRRQQQSQLEQAISDKQAEIAQAQQSIVATAIAARAQAANTQSSRDAVSQQQAQTDLARGYALTSPVDGIVTALTARIGQPVTADQQLMLVVPLKAQLQVELYVPTVAAGFLSAGQEVRLSIDAFPYQKFGTVAAQIVSVSNAAISKQGQNGPVPVYLVVARIAHPWVIAFGRKQPLLPGMTLSARIITEKRSLIEWLFEPLFAVRQR